MLTVEADSEGRGTHFVDQGAFGALPFFSSSSRRQQRTVARTRAETKTTAPPSRSFVFCYFLQCSCRVTYAKKSPPLSASASFITVARGLLDVECNTWETVIML